MHVTKQHAINAVALTLWFGFWIWWAFAFAAAFNANKPECEPVELTFMGLPPAPDCEGKDWNTCMMVPLK